MSESTTRFRPEIQGLRAVAVLVVLVFHVWPAVLPGGYVGVDVFFVISGYLITGLLLADAEARGTISLRAFYARRIKRLLPASTAVLITAAAATGLLPADRREETSAEIAASALYVQNWWLAGRARDYLASDDAPSLLQHFWSLSVEEQYYIAWPLMFLLLLQLRRARPRAIFAGLVVAVFVVSLGHSIRATTIEAGTAYFSTGTRAWELALGGALAVFPHWRALGEPLRALAGVLGLCAIGYASLAFGAGTAFPGYAALVPTLGAALVLVAGSQRRRFSFDVLLESRPMQYLGDISYSLYLWHWPVVTVYGERVGRGLGLFDGVAVLLLSVALAHASKKWIEDPFRRRDFAAGAPWQPFALAGACIALSLGGAGIVRAIDAADAEPHTDPQRLAGARALHEPGYDWRKEDLNAIAPRPARAIKDLPRAYEQHCLQRFRGSKVKRCEYGSKQGTLRIALIGDSHAAHWFPAFEALSERHPVRFFGLAKSACMFSLDPVFDRTIGGPYEECVDWSRGVLSWLARERPDLVLVAQSPRHRVRAERSASDDDELGRGMAKAWREVVELGLRFASFKNTPWLPGKASDCLSTSAAWQAQCTFPRQSVVSSDAADVAAQLTKTPRVDMLDAICVGDRCPPVIGGVLVYRDSHHITATYARTLADDLQRALAKLTPWPR